MSFTTELIHIGSKVQVKDVEFDEVSVTYQIVGSSEADPSNGRISDEFRWERACLGHKVGETVEIETPACCHAVRNIRISVVQMRTGAARMHSVRFFKIIIGSCHYERRKDHSGKITASRRRRT